MKVKRRACQAAMLLLVVITALLTSTAAPVTASAEDKNSDRIQPYAKNPFYWQYKGEPVLLIGGSGQDNLFNHPIGLVPAGTLEAHLDLLVSAGGNWLRNTMSTRDEGDVYAYARNGDGRFDLERWNDEYWNRLRSFLAMAQARDIVVQIELFDPHDYYRDIDPLGGWSRNPFRPANNVNYTESASGLPDVVDWSGVHNPEKNHPFFQSAPAERDLGLVRSYQDRLVVKVLDVSIGFPNVLYCVSNESNNALAWSDYWAGFLRRESERRGVPIQVGEMRFRVPPEHPDMKHLIARTDLYDFIDISQLNRPVREQHWQQLMQIQAMLNKHPRPLNNTKIYGSDLVGWTGGYRTGEECFWRNIFAGCASARFHRPDFGRGLSPEAQVHLRSMRMLTERIDVFRARGWNDLLSERSGNEAYCMAIPGEAYAVYFPDGGAVKLDVSAVPGVLELRWLDIPNSVWRLTQQTSGGGALELKAPGAGHWAVLIVAAGQDKGSK